MATPTEDLTTRLVLCPGHDLDGHSGLLCLAGEPHHPHASPAATYDTHIPVSAELKSWLLPFQPSFLLMLLGKLQKVSLVLCAWYKAGALWG